MTNLFEQKQNKDGCSCGCKFCCCGLEGKIIALVALLVVLFIGIVLGCSCNKKTKVAVVDLVSLVSKSSEVQALKKEQDMKAQELTLWLQGAQEKVNMESDQAKKEVLLKQYSAEFAAKREDIRQQYNQKLQVLDKNITALISNEAQKRGYALVIAKAYTLYGATDITEELAKVIK